MVQFQDVGELRAHLLGWEAVYVQLWPRKELSIRSSEMIAGYLLEVLANILAAGVPLRQVHTGRAHDMTSCVTSDVLHGVHIYT